MANYLLRRPFTHWIVHRPQFRTGLVGARKLLKNEKGFACYGHLVGQRSLHNHFEACIAQRNVHDILRLTKDTSFLQVCPVSWSVIRTYAKKGKDKGGKAHKKVTLTSEQLEGMVDMDKVQGDMEHIMEDLKDKFIHQVTLRTSQGVFDNLIIKTPDGNFPLIQLGQVIQKSPQLVVLNMAAAPQYIVNVKEALSGSGLNINPQQDGTSLFLPLPKVTREHREALTKNAKMLSEKSKKQLREVFTRCSKKIKSAKTGHSSDDMKAAVDMVEDLMHEKIQQIESMTALKQKELMGTK